jgi:hypothetical protein
MPTILPTTASLATTPTWDGERRVAGGALAGDPPALQGDDEFTFGDFLSILNPLQHIPVVSSVYRWVTGDTLKPAARVIGGAIYGGPMGLVTAAINAIVEEVKGADIGAQLIAMVTPESRDRAAPDQAAPKLADARDVAEAGEKATPTEGAEALAQLAADLRSGDTTVEEPKPTPVAAPILPGQRRNLAFYQAHAGQRLPTVDGGRSSAPAPRYTVPAQFQALAAAPASVQPAAEKNGAAETSMPPEGSPDSWFAAAMMRGLDRYRASQQLKRAAPQLDVSH